MLDIKIIFFALIGGVLPAILWLLFWLEEDKKRPEPKGLLIETFIAGMVGVILVIPLQKIVQDLFLDSINTSFFLWAAIEELFKLCLVYLVALRTKSMDEPIDAMIYMITGTLGFVALENTFFIINPLLQGNVIEGVTTGSLRFIGASLLHTVSSATIGIAIGLSFYKNKYKKMVYLLVGICLAIALHTIFNIAIFHSGELNTFTIFSIVWVAITLLILFFEKIKTVSTTNINNSYDTINKSVQ